MYQRNRVMNWSFTVADQLVTWPIASFAGISSCHFRSYTISSSRKRSRESRSAARYGAWIICSSEPIPHSYQLPSITIWPTSAITHPWSIKFSAIFVKDKHKRRLRRRLWWPILLCLVFGSAQLFCSRRSNFDIGGGGGVWPLVTRYWGGDKTIFLTNSLQF